MTGCVNFSKHHKLTGPALPILSRIWAKTLIHIDRAFDFVLYRSLKSFSDLHDGQAGRGRERMLQALKYMAEKQWRLYSRLVFRE